MASNIFPIVQHLHCDLYFTMLFNFAYSYYIVLTGCIHYAVITALSFFSCNSSGVSEKNLKYAKGTMPFLSYRFFIFYHYWILWFTSTK